MENKIISVVSGGFDPIHPGHIMMMKECLEFSNFLIVGVNSNKWLIDKKGNFFMDIQMKNPGVQLNQMFRTIPSPFFKFWVLPDSMKKNLQRIVSGFNMNQAHTCRIAKMGAQYLKCKIDFFKFHFGVGV